MLNARSVTKTLALLLVAGGVLALVDAARPEAAARLGPTRSGLYWGAHALLIVVAGHRFIRPAPLGGTGSLLLAAGVAGSVWTEVMLRAGEGTLPFAARLAFFAACYFGLRMAGRRG